THALAERHTDARRLLAAEVRKERGQFFKAIERHPSVYGEKLELMLGQPAAAFLDPQQRRNKGGVHQVFLGFDLPQQAAGAVTRDPSHASLSTRKSRKAETPGRIRWDGASVAV